MANSRGIRRGTGGLRAGLPSVAARRAWTPKTMTVVLTTERLRLRPLEAGDLDALHTLCMDPDVRRYLWDNRIVSRETVEEVIQRSSAMFAAQGYGFFALEFPDATKRDLVGFCGYRQFEDTPQVELLYAIAPEYWGEGLVSEAAVEVLRHGFETCGIERVVASTDTPNQRSVRVLQRLGMTFDCRREFHGLDTVFYSMTRDEFDTRDITVRGAARVPHDD